MDATGSGGEITCTFDRNSVVTNPGSMSSNPTVNYPSQPPASLAPLSYVTPLSQIAPPSPRGPSFTFDPGAGRGLVGTGGRGSLGPRGSSSTR